MKRTPEPELMDEASQARAYAEADFSEPHDRMITLFAEKFPGDDFAGTALDLGCGPADITIRFARAHPRCRIHGVDGAQAMLAFGHAAVRDGRLEDRIRLICGYLPGATLPLESYDAIISNSLLHHLDDPSVLWNAVREYGHPGTRVFIMDLMRPDSAEAVDALVEEYASNDPDVLRRDFRASLHAAYRPDEIRQQLARASLGFLDVAPVSDRHLVVSGHFGSA